MARGGSRAYCLMNQGSLIHYSLFLVEWFLIMPHPQAATIVACVK